MNACKYGAPLEIIKLLIESGIETNNMNEPELFKILKEEREKKVLVYNNIF